MLAWSLNTMPKNQKKWVINAVRKYALDKIVNEIRFILSDMPKLQKDVIGM